MQHSQSKLRRARLGLTKHDRRGAKRAILVEKISVLTELYVSATRAYALALPPSVQPMQVSTSNVAMILSTRVTTTYGEDARIVLRNGRHRRRGWATATVIICTPCIGLPIVIQTLLRNVNRH